MKMSGLNVVELERRDKEGCHYLAVSDCINLVIIPCIKLVSADINHSGDDDHGA